MNARKPTIGQWLVSDEAQLTPSFRRVARALLADYPAAGLDTIASLGEAAGVSGPTVLRFAKSLGYGSFREFQDALRLELSGRDESALMQAQTRDQGIDERSMLADGVAETLSSLPEAELRMAVKLLSSPRRTVFCYGGDFTGVAAEQLALQLGIFRPNVRLASENNALAAAEIADTRNNDVWCIFDVRRYHDRAYRIAQHVRAAGACVVLFTDGWLSPAAKFADVVLTTRAEAPGSLDTVVPLVALVELVCNEVLDNIGDAAIERLRSIEPIRRALID